MTFQINMKTFFFIFPLLLVIGILSSCSNNLITIETEEIITPTEFIVFSSGELGGVKGKLITNDPSEKVGLILYLGDIITDSNGMHGSFLDPSNAPVAIINTENGVFSFSDVKPGNYSLIIHEVVFGGKAYTDEVGNLEIVNVKGGEITNLGEIHFDGF